MSKWKLKPDIKKKWLKALKSGEYEKGRGCLVEKVGGKTMWCCLGVYADLFISEEWAEYPLRHPDLIEYYFVDRGDSYSATLPPTEVPVGVQSQLMSINDSQSTFDGVIEYIEENL